MHLYTCLLAKRRKSIKVNSVFIHTVIYFIFLSSSYACTACIVLLRIWATDFFTAKMLPCNNRKTAVVNITHGSVSYDRKLAWTVKVAPPNESQSFGWCIRRLFFIASTHELISFLVCASSSFLSNLWPRNVCQSNILNDVSIPKMHLGSGKKTRREETFTLNHCRLWWLVEPELCSTCFHSTSMFFHNGFMRYLNSLIEMLQKESAISLFTELPLCWLSFFGSKSISCLKQNCFLTLTLACNTGKIFSELYHKLFCHKHISHCMVRKSLGSDRMLLWLITQTRFFSTNSSQHEDEKRGSSRWINIKIFSSRTNLV